MVNAVKTLEGENHNMEKKIKHLEVKYAKFEKKLKTLEEKLLLLESVLTKESDDEKHSEDEQKKL